MIEKPFILHLDGEVSLDRLTVALDVWRRALVDIGEHVGASHVLGSEVRDLQTGSAIIGVSITFDAPSPADAFTLTYDRLGQRARGDAVPGFPSQLEPHVSELQRIVSSDGGQGMTLASESADTFIPAVPPTDPKRAPSAPYNASSSLPHTEAYGVVGGRLQSLSNRKGLHIVLYDDLFDRAVRCVVPQEEQDALRELWDREVLVEGLVRRDAASGRPLSIRNIRRIVARTSPIDPRAWVRARGALKDVAPEIPSEEMMRRIRNG
ncbi:MAG: hypothetical protein ACTHQE_00050 [Thermomicrobiales bacterium]